MSRTLSGDKIVISGEENGALFPTNREETFKDIHVNGAKKKFYVSNSAFSPNLKFTGSGVIRGPVFATETIRLENDGKVGAQCFQSGLATHGSIIAESLGDNKLSATVSAGIENARYIIRGDVVAGEFVKLTNAVVLGSVFAESLELVNSIVFGTCRVSGELISTFSGLSIYRTRSLKLIGPTKFFTTSGVSIEEPVFEKYDHLDETYPAIMIYDPLCRYHDVLKNNWVNKEKITDLENISLYKGDFTKIEEPERIKKILDKFSFNIKSQEIPELYFFGIEGRGFNMEDVFNRNQVFNDIMNGVFIFEHLTSEKKEEIKNLWIDNMTEEEINILEIATDGF